jgi:thioredoxin 1
MPQISAISDANFDTEVLAESANQPVLVDFWATWCGPCKALAPKLEELAGEYDGKIKIVKMDVDQNRASPAKFGIRGIPTLILFKDGKMFDQVVGNQPKEVLQDLFNRSL